jgi:hypothetical protein
MLRQGKGPRAAASGEPPLNKLRVTVFPNVSAQSAEVRHFTPAELVEFIRGTAAPDKEHLPLLKLGYFGDQRTRKGSLRSDRNLHFISGVELDYDAETMSFADAVAVAEKLPLLCIVYSSPRHLLNGHGPRWRLLAPLSEELPRKDRKRLVDRINGHYATHGATFHSESWADSQSFFFGIAGGAPHFQIELIDGEPVDRLHDLDLIARGKAQRSATGNGHAFEGSTAGLTEAQLATLITSGTQYHEATLRLATIWGRQGIEASEAEDRLTALFDEVPPELQDRERWQRRRAEVPRLVAGMYCNVERERSEQQARSMAGLADLDDRSGESLIAAGIVISAGAKGAKDDDHDHDHDPDRASEADKHWGSAPHFRDPWADTEPAATWPRNTLPVAVNDMVFTTAQAIGVDPAAQALATLAAISGAAPKSSKFAPYGTDEIWRVPPILWTMIVAPSGFRKTALDTPFAALQVKQDHIWGQFAERLAEWEALSQAEQKKQRRPREPHAYIAVDSSPERLQITLAQNPRGSILKRDELAPFFGFGRYTQDKGASERGFYLESYEGGPYTVMRVGRPSLHIKVNGLTVWGRIQPTRLQQFKGLEDDGLLQRFIIYCARAAVPARSMQITGKAEFDAKVEKLALMGGHHYHADPVGADIIRRLEADALAYSTLYDFGPGFQGFCGKLHGTCARLALILHLLECDNPTVATVRADTIARANRITREFTLPNVAHFYRMLSPERVERTRAIAAWLLTESPERLRASDFGRHVRVCRNLPLPELNQALDPLVGGGWLEPASPFPQNNRWRLDLRVRDELAHRVKTAADQRERGRKLVESISAAARRDEDEVA